MTVSHNNNISNVNKWQSGFFQQSYCCYAISLLCTQCCRNVLTLSGSRPRPHSPSKCWGLNFRIFRHFFTHRPSPDSTGAPTVRSRARQALRRTPLALTGAPADGPRHRPLFWPFAVGLDHGFRRPSSASSGFSPSAPNFGEGSHQPSPALAGFSQFVPGLDRAIRLGSPRASSIQFWAKNRIAFGHVYSLPSVKASIFMKQIMTIALLTKVAFKVSYNFFAFTWLCITCIFCITCSLFVYIRPNDLLNVMLVRLSVVVSCHPYFKTFLANVSTCLSTSREISSVCFCPTVLWVLSGGTLSRDILSWIRSAIVLELRPRAVRVWPGRSSWNFYTMFRYSRPHTRPGIHPTRGRVGTLNVFGRNMFNFSLCAFYTSRRNLAPICRPWLVLKQCPVYKSPFLFWHPYLTRWCSNTLKMW